MKKYLFKTEQDGSAAPAKCILKGHFACSEMMQICDVRPCSCDLRIQHNTSRSYSRSPYTIPTLTNFGSTINTMCNVEDLRNATMLEF